MADLLIIRVLFIAVLGCAAFFLRPLDLSAPVAALVGVLAGAGDDCGLAAAVQPKTACEI